MTNENLQGNQAVYIQSIEASDIYSHMYRGRKIKDNYVGMIPYSLELRKLKETGIKTRRTTTSNKVTTDDVINVKFNQCAIDWKEIKKHITNKIDRLSEQIEKMEKKQLPKKKKMAYKAKEKIDKKKNYKQKLSDWIETNNDKGMYPLWSKMSQDSLRKMLYVYGFTITNDKGKQTEYVMYKRSSSKSRNGEILAIKKSIYNKMIKWSRMGLHFRKDKNIDLPSLMAYEALVGSTIERIINIDPNKILIINDYESEFTWKAAVVQKGKDGYLDCVVDNNAKISNSLFDGQSLLDIKHFPEGKGMMQLRNHMFKSAAFNTNIQLFLQDKHKEMTNPNHDNYDSLIPVNYDGWEIENKFGQTILAKDIEMITTPSSAKCLKFSHVFPGDNKDMQMWDYWKEYVEVEGNAFGVCRSEQETGKGYNYDGQFVNQTSYQMINSMDLHRQDLLEMTEFEREYLDNLKNKDDEFIKHISKTANNMNVNDMLIDLYHTNPDIVYTKLFKDFRKAEINRHANHIRKGKVRIPADYCVILGNPMIMLGNAIGLDKGDTQVLHGNEVHTTLFPFNRNLVGCRNPHTSPSNLLLSHNKESKEIDRYFNLSKNIVAVNADEFPINQILSGQDYDGDQMMLMDSGVTVNKVIAMDGQYPVSTNNVEGTKKKYKLNRESMYEIDRVLATSTKNIGTVVNLAQEILSLYWDGKRMGASKGDLEKLLNKVEVFTILSEINIDMAKKLYDIDIADEIKHMEDTTNLRSDKPLFFKTVKQSKTIKDRVKFYDTPMDILTHIINKIDAAADRETIDVVDLMGKYGKRNVNGNQQADIISRVYSLQSSINGIQGTSYSSKREKYEALDNVIKYHEFYIDKKEINLDTMAETIRYALDNESRIANKLMNILYKTKKSLFLTIFDQKNSQK